MVQLGLDAVLSGTPATISKTKVGLKVVPPVLGRIHSFEPSILDFDVKHASSKA